MTLPRASARLAWLLAALAILGSLAFFAHRPGRPPAPGALTVEPLSPPSIKLASFTQEEGASLTGGVGWVNSGPITLEELRGKIVLLDFWTFCCINCHHVLPDLAKLEEKYRDELVVIGVHTPKFTAEADMENLRHKVAEYRIKHPVINDARMVLWNRFEVSSWPTLVLIDVNGRVVGRVSGEGNYATLDRAIGQLVLRHKERGELNLAPLQFTPEMDRTPEGPLLFPGKIVADATGRRLFISDTGHNRIVRCGLDGSDAIAIGNGQEGFEDGPFDKARFNRPQGMYLDGETLYVADTENHAIRAVDLKAGTVSTVAGTGSQMRRIYQIPFRGPALTTALSSPWDVIKVGDENILYIAMAGPHQIWKLDLAKQTVGVFAGTGGENIINGGAEAAWFAQPSGLATDGDHLYVADSEVSGVRVISGLRTREPIVGTVVGRGLFEFADHDGTGAAVRLQHCLGLAYGNGHLYIADTYNNKIKACIPRSHSVHTLVGTHKAGDSDNPPSFYEPGGISVAGEELYVADTNNHKIRVVDLKTHAVKTIPITGLSAPRPAPKPPSFRNATVVDVPTALASPGDSVTFTVNVPLGPGDKLNEEVQTVYLVDAPGKPGALSDKVKPEGERIKPAHSFPVVVPLAKPAADGDTLELKVSVQAFVCSGTSNVCRIQSTVWNVPLKFSAARPPGEPITLPAPARKG